MNTEGANYIAIHLTEIRLILGILVSAIVAMAGGFVYIFHYITKMSRGFTKTILEQSMNVITVTKDCTHAMDKLTDSVDQNTRTLEQLPGRIDLIVRAAIK